MPDQRITDYLRQHMAAHPVAALKQALLKNGFAEPDIDAAIAQLSRPSVGGAEPEAPVADYVDYSLKNLAPNAKTFFTAPAEFFGRIDPSGTIGRPLVYMMAWAAASGAITGLVVILRQGNVLMAAGAAVAGVVFMPVFMAVMGFVTSGIWHVVCKLIGGQGTYLASYGAIAGMSPLFPISSLLGLLPFGVVLAQVGGLYYSVEAAVAVHQVPKKRAWMVFGILTALAAAFTVMGTLATQKLQGQLGSGIPGMGMPASAGAEASADAGVAPETQQAMDMAQQMVQGMTADATPEQRRQMEAALAQAQGDGARMLGEMGQYAQMDAPPEKTLALLDGEGRGYLKEQWTTLAAPIRQSLVQTLPQVKPEQRNAVLRKTIEQTAQINETLNQSMQLIQGMMKNQKGAQ